MNSKKHYNNLFDSIAMTALAISFIICYVFMVYFGVIHPRAGTNPKAAFIAANLLLGSCFIVSITLVFKDCFSWWNISDNTIYFKTILGKRKEIRLDEITYIERKIVPALIFSNYQSDAYIISGDNVKITILINKKNEKFLESFFKKYFDYLWESGIDLPGDRG